MEQKVKDSRKLRREKRGNDCFKKLESQEQSEFKKKKKKPEEEWKRNWEKTEQTAVLHIKLAPISRCALRRSLSLSLWSGKMYFSAFYTHVFMKW